MRIQLILPGLSIGGTEKMVVRLAEGLKKAGDTVQVVALKKSGPMGERLQQTGVPFETLNTPDSLIAGTIDLPRLVFTLRRRIRKFKPDVIHSFLTRANAAAAWAACGMSISVVASLRVMEREKQFHFWVERQNAKNKTYTVNSQALKAFAQKQLGLRPDQIEVIYNGVEPPRDVPPAEIAALRQRLGFANALVFLAAGRLHAQKGFDWLIPVFKGVTDRHPDAVLLIAGEGGEKTALEKEIQRFGLVGRVRLIGAVPDLLPYLKLAVGFILSSRWEGTPNVVLEAMAAGCAVIATDVGGVREILKAPGEGLIVAPGRTDDFQNALIDTLENTSARQARAATALRRAASFDFKTMVDAHRRLYSRLSARKKEPLLL